MQLFTRFGALGSAVLLLSAGLPAVAQQASGESYEVNAILPMTGAAAFLGGSEQKALHALETLTNANGGIHGRPLRFTILDDQTNPQVAVQLENGLNAKHVPVILGPGSSATCAAITPITADGPASYCLSPAIHPAKGSYQFSASVGTADLLALFVRYFRLNGWTRFAVLDATDATGQDFDRLIDPTLAAPENKAVTLTGHEHFAPGDVSVQAQVVRLASEKPQAIVVWTTGTGLGTALRAIHDVGLTVPVLTVAGNMVAAQLQQYASFMPTQLLFTGVMSAGTTAGRPSDAMTRYLNALKAAGAAPDFGTNIAWDPATLIVEALRALPPNPSADQVRDWIEALHGWQGIDGAYDFRDGNQRGIGQNATVVFRWDAPTNSFIGMSRPGGTLL